MSLGIAKDEPESLVTLARSGRAADILLTIGGASVGERDLVASALKPEGLELDFWKIAMRPGKPLLFGRLGSQRVLGLPGNPVSALRHGSRLPRADAGADARARPDDEGASPRRSSARRCRPMAAREHYMGAVSEWREDGTRVVRPLPSQELFARRRRSPAPTASSYGCRMRRLCRKAPV